MNSSLTKQQAMDVNWLAMRVSKIIIVSYVVIAIAAGILLAMMTNLTAQKPHATTIMATSFLIETLISVGLGWFLLYPCLAKITRKVRLKFATGPADRPLFAHWLLIVLGVKIAAIALTWFVSPSIAKGLGIGGAIAGLYAANYYLIFALLKSGQASLESGNSSNSLLRP